MVLLLDGLLNIIARKGRKDEKIAKIHEKLNFQIAYQIR